MSRCELCDARQRTLLQQCLHCRFVLCDECFKEHARAYMRRPGSAEYWGRRHRQWREEFARDF